MDLRYGYITGVFTEKRYRKKGFQKEILTVLIDYAKKEKLSVLELDSENLLAINLYKQFNFKVEDKDRVIMKLYLNEK